jgi:hypothetical protein
VKRLALVLATLPLLVSCGEKHGECIKSHQEYQPPIYIKVGNVMVPSGGGYHTVCDEYGPTE